MEDQVIFRFDGGMASEGRLDLYDAAQFLLGAARVYSIIGHYYATGDIIHHAPRSVADVYILPAEEGSFKQALMVGVITSIVTAPFATFSSRLMDSWFPPQNPKLERQIELLEEQNRLLRRQLDLPEQETEKEKEDKQEVDRFIEENQKECHVIRSVLAKSTKDMFRPIGRSASTVSICYGEQERPAALLDRSDIIRMESEKIDSRVVVVVGVVNGFSRSTKSGVVFSKSSGRGFLFSYDVPGKLGDRDIFSWSQYSRHEIKMTGYFVKFFDGTVKRFIVEEAEFVEGQSS